MDCYMPTIDISRRKRPICRMPSNSIPFDRRDPAFREQHNSFLDNGGIREEEDEDEGGPTTSG